MIQCNIHSLTYNIEIWISMSWVIICRNENITYEFFQSFIFIFAGSQQPKIKSLPRFYHLNKSQKSRETEKDTGM